MTRSEYESACYHIGIKPIDIPDEILDEITEQQWTSLFYNPDDFTRLHLLQQHNLWNSICAYTGHR